MSRALWSRGMSAGPQARDSCGLILSLSDLACALAPVTQHFASETLKGKSIKLALSLPDHQGWISIVGFISWVLPCGPSKQWN